MDENLNAQEQKRALQGLLESKGWSILRATLEEQVKLRTDDLILRPSSEIEGGYVQLEFMKGEIAGIRTVLATAEALLSEASQLVEDKLTEQKEESDDDSDSDLDDASDSSFEPDPWPG
jgi:hypothetical protein